jgi:hypothetical protein
MQMLISCIAHHRERGSAREPNNLSLDVSSEDYKQDKCIHIEKLHLNSKLSLFLFYMTTKVPWSSVVRIVLKYKNHAVFRPKINPILFSKNNI